MSTAVPPTATPPKPAKATPPPRAKTPVTRYGGANRQRVWTFLYTTAWLILLLTVAIDIRLPSNPLSPLLPASWEMTSAIGAWFAMLGAVAISYKGVYDHWQTSEWETGGWALWYVGRPFSGAIAGLMTYLLLQIVNPNQPPSTTALAVVAFILGTQERLFFEFLQNVASLVLTTPQSKPRAPASPSPASADAAPADGSPTDVLLAPLSGIVSPAGAAGAGPAVAGAATHFVDGGGKVLTQVAVQLMFWGTKWAAGRAGPSAQQVTEATQSILQSTYMSALDQYRGIQAGSLAAPVSITDSDPPAVFQDRDVANFIRQQIDKGRVPDPDANEQLLYCVIMPPGVRGSNPNVIGEHSYFVYFGYKPPFDLDLNLAHFAWVTNDATLNGITTILSHELVESCTDPEGNGFKAVSGPCPDAGWCEIGDVCYDTGPVNGVTVQAYWSEKDATCVIPGS